MRVFAENSDYFLLLDVKVSFLLLPALVVMTAVIVKEMSTLFSGSEEVVLHVEVHLAGLVFSIGLDFRYELAVLQDVLLGKHPRVNLLVQLLLLVASQLNRK